MKSTALRKTCLRCGEVKTHFVKSKRYTDGESNLCIDCKRADYQKNREKNLEWYRRNRKRQILNRSDRYYRDKELELVRNKKWWRAHPWRTTMYRIKERCCSPSHPSYHRYGGRGIKISITIKEIEALWFRDRAYELKSPSIDRIDNNGDYTFENCQFIERAENSRRKSCVTRK